MGTGEKKWTPTTRSGRSVAAAILVIGMAEVFEASTVSSRTTLSRARKISCFTSSFSKTASTTMSASAAASRSVVAVIRPRAASAFSAANFPLLTNLSYDAVMPPMPRLSASSVTSRRTTSQPACADTWAIPDPMSPAPMTASFRATVRLPWYALLMGYLFGGH